MSIIQLIELPDLSDERGGLVALEQNKSVPFEIKRVYYLHSTASGYSRGYHAHINLKQIAICVSGSCKMLIDDGSRREEVLLDSPTKGIFIESMIWREMHDFSHDCVLLVIASEHYDESDYIRSYDEFLRLSK